MVEDMTRATKTACLLALLLVVGLVAGCGGSESSTADGGDGGNGGSAGGPPRDASVEEFCGTFTAMIQQASEAGQDISDADAIKVAKDTAAKLAQIGTPEDIPDDARRAFERAIEKIESIPDDADRKEMDDIAEDLTEAEQADLDALTSYVTSTCLSLPSGAPAS
jgi:hypothetical protein